MPEAGALDRRFLDGQMSEPAAPLALRAGPLTLLFDGGGLRYVRFGEQEIVRRVYYAVRDANWGTVQGRISNLRTEVLPQSLRIEFDVENKQSEIDYAWHGVVTGEASGRISFEASGVAKSTFRKNRVGFCVLHPMECAGLPVQIRHADGSIEKSAFPRYIAAPNPFLDVVGMRHAASEDALVDLQFEGDVFETEDQRNWIDASFKTFCTPLSKPFPVEVGEGEQIVQRITIEVRGATRQPVAIASTDRTVELELVNAPIGPLPRVGFSLPADMELSAVQIERLRLLKPAHLRCALRLGREFESVLRRAATIAHQAGADVELALFVGLDRSRELERLVRIVEEVRPRIARWIVFPETGWCTTRELADFAAGYLGGFDGEIPIGGGTPANFRELNAKRPSMDALDFVTWALTPQIHAFDNASLVETLAAHAATVESARQFAGGRPLVVGPITLKMQVNPYATGDWPPTTPAGQLPPQVDVRQLSLFGAGWTLGSIKYLAESGVQAATYYEVAGWKGLMEWESGSPLPELFPSLPGSVFPLYHVFADLAEVQDAQVVPIRSSQPLRVEALAVRGGTRMRVMIANFSSRAESVELGTQANSARIRMLDESRLLQAMTSPAAFRQHSEPVQLIDHVLEIDLPPFTVATVDLM